MHKIKNKDAVTLTHIKKTYGGATAVNDISFSVREGEIFGLLGPNGAGKTTIVECLTGLRTPDAGTVDVLGFNPQINKTDLHPLVGVQLQASMFPDKLRAGEILNMYQSFYDHPTDAKELAGGLGLSDTLHTYYKNLSGGQKQRLSVAVALVGQPKLAVLDEMTTGLDPQARLNVWELLESMCARGTTIILVTHFMEEAVRLCDRLAIIDNGRIIAMDTPQGVTESVAGGKRVRFVPSSEFPDHILTNLPEVKTVARKGRHIEVSGSGDLINAVILTLNKYGIAAKDVSMEVATLEDAFIKLTGRRLHEEERVKQHG
jgi:ABC-2 type transport system ATP-binding protein